MPRRWRAPRNGWNALESSGPRGSTPSRRRCARRMPWRPRRKNRPPRQSQGARNERHEHFHRASHGATRAPASRTDRARLGLSHRIRQARDLVRGRHVRSARGRQGGPAFRPLEHFVGENTRRVQEQEERLARNDHARGASAPPELHLRARGPEGVAQEDRKSTRLNSSHQIISYAVFCLKKKKDKSTYKCVT